MSLPRITTDFELIPLYGCRTGARSSSIKFTNVLSMTLLSVIRSPSTPSTEIAPITDNFGPRLQSLRFAATAPRGLVPYFHLMSRFYMI
jgi:hypothetical protein